MTFWIVLILLIVVFLGIALLSPPKYSSHSKYSRYDGNVYYKEYYDDKEN